MLHVRCCWEGTSCGATVAHARTWPGCHFHTIRSSVSNQAMAAPQNGVRRFAVLGAGFAGVSAAWHLLQHTSATAPVCVEVYDEGGIGAGASGVSGGLLHPYTPKGKLLWKGAEGFAAALRLLEVAESYNSGVVEHGCSDQAARLCTTEPIAWRRGIVRPALLEKHAADFMKNVQDRDDRDVKCLDSLALRELVPGLEMPRENLVGLYIPHAVNLHPERYLQALWTACGLYAQTANIRGCVGTQALLYQENIASLSSLTGRFEAVVVCLGAKACLLPELAGKLPISNCRGIVADLELPTQPNDQRVGDSPSILANTWLAMQGGRHMIMGATKDWVSENLSSTVSEDEAIVAYKELLQKTEAFYPSVSQWEVVRVRAGVRAMAPRTSLGALPLVGCIDRLVHGWDGAGEVKNTRTTKFWVLGGLGSRGLVYHSLIGEQVAQAMVEADDDKISTELRQWTKSIGVNEEEVRK